MIKFPPTARCIQHKNSPEGTIVSTIVEPETGESYRITELPGVYPFRTERLYTLAEARDILVAGHV